MKAGDFEIRARKGLAGLMRSRLQRAGLAGVAFFAAKGLLWLVVPLLLATFECGS